MKSNNEIMEISNTNDTKLPLTFSIDNNVKTEITTTLQQKPNHKLGSNIQKFNMKSIRHEQETKISKHQKPSIKKIFNFSHHYTSKADATSKKIITETIK